MTVIDIFEFKTTQTYTDFCTDNQKNMWHPCKRTKNFYIVVSLKLLQKIPFLSSLNLRSAMLIKLESRLYFAKFYNFQHMMLFNNHSFNFQFFLSFNKFVCWIFNKINEIKTNLKKRNTGFRSFLRVDYECEIYNIFWTVLK